MAGESLLGGQWTVPPNWLGDCDRHSYKFLAPPAVQSGGGEQEMEEDEYECEGEDSDYSENSDGEQIASETKRLIKDIPQKVRKEIERACAGTDHADIGETLLQRTSFNIDYDGSRSSATKSVVHTKLWCPFGHPAWAEFMMENYDSVGYSTCNMLFTISFRLGTGPVPSGHEGELNQICSNKFGPWNRKQTINTKGFTAEVWEKIRMHIMGDSPAIPLVSYIKIVLASLGIYSDAASFMGYTWPSTYLYGKWLNEGKEDPLIAKMRADGVLNEVCAEWGIEMKHSIPILPVGTTEVPEWRHGETAERRALRKEFEELREQEEEFRKTIATTWLDHHLRKITGTGLKSDAYYQPYDPSVDEEPREDEYDEEEDDDYSDEDQ